MITFLTKFLVVIDALSVVVQTSTLDKQRLLASYLSSNSLQRAPQSMTNSCDSLHFYGKVSIWAQEGQIISTFR